MHFKEACPLCEGSGKVFGHWHECHHCSGKGGIDTWSKGCRRNNMHYKHACHQCDGRGYKQ